jgi:hypothetical protein
MAQGEPASTSARISQNRAEVLGRIARAVS